MTYVHVALPTCFPLSSPPLVDDHDFPGCVLIKLGFGAFDPMYPSRRDSVKLNGTPGPNVHIGNKFNADNTFEEWMTTAARMGGHNHFQLRAHIYQVWDLHLRYPSSPFLLCIYLFHQARNLPSVDSNGLCDPYLRVRNSCKHYVRSIPLSCLLWILHNR